MPSPPRNRTTTTRSELVVIGFGANLDNPRHRFLAAERRLKQLLDDVTRSSIYLSAPVGFLGQPDFHNAAIAGRTTQTPGELLRELKRIEAALGRRPRFRNGPREIDLDLLLHGRRLRRVRPPLTPHPRLLERPFALIPAAEVAPTLRIPGSTNTLAEAAARCRTRLERIAAPDDW